MTRTFLFRTFAFLGSLVLSTISGAAEFSYERVLKSTSIFIRGEIVPGDYERFVSFIEADVDKFLARKIVVLVSPGGDLAEAVRISEIIRGTYKFVMVAERFGKCASACFLIYASAAHRDATEGSLGIHRPYFPPAQFEKLTLAEAEKHQRELMRGVRVFLERHEVPQYLIERMFSLASDEVYWLEREDLERIGLRANWYDQVLVARCGLDKDLERGFTRMGNDYARLEEASRNFDEVADCSEELTEGESQGNLENILRGK